MYKVRAILDTQEDVIRTVLIENGKSLEALHFMIAKAFGFDGQEMASFYTADDEWNQGEEIPLFDMSEAGEGISMAKSILNETLLNVNEKLIYVYDFLNMWTFYIEVVEITNTSNEEKVILSVGEVPKAKNEDSFDLENIMNSYEEEFKDTNEDEFDRFESLDDIDLDNY